MEACLSAELVSYCLRSWPAPVQRCSGRQPWHSLRSWRVQRGERIQWVAHSLSRACVWSCKIRASLFPIPLFSFHSSLPSALSLSLRCLKRARDFLCASLFGEKFFFQPLRHRLWYCRCYCRRRGCFPSSPFRSTCWYFPSFRLRCYSASSPVSSRSSFHQSGSSPRFPPMYYWRGSFPWPHPRCAFPMLRSHSLFPPASCLLSICCLRCFFGVHMLLFFG